MKAQARSLEERGESMDVRRLSLRLRLQTEVLGERVEALVVLSNYRGYLRTFPIGHFAIGTNVVTYEGHEIEVVVERKAYKTDDGTETAQTITTSILRTPREIAASR